MACAEACRWLAAHLWRVRRRVGGWLRPSVGSSTAGALVDCRFVQTGFYNLWAQVSSIVTDLSTGTDPHRHNCNEHTRLTSPPGRRRCTTAAVRLYPAPGAPDEGFLRRPSRTNLTQILTKSKWYALVSRRHYFRALQLHFSLYTHRWSLHPPCCCSLQLHPGRWGPLTSACRDT